METRVNCQNLGSNDRTKQKFARCACLTVKSCFVTEQEVVAVNGVMADGRVLFAL